MVTSKKRIKNPPRWRKLPKFDKLGLKNSTHLTWWRFCDYIERKWGQETADSRFSTGSLIDNLCGWEVQVALEKWCKRYAPDIKIVRVDDDVHSSSCLFLVPHPEHGISVVFVPQNTTVHSTFFFYRRGFQQMKKALVELEYVFEKEKLEAIEVLGYDPEV